MDWTGNGKYEDGIGFSNRTLTSSLLSLADGDGLLKLDWGFEELDLDKLGMSHGGMGEGSFHLCNGTPWHHNMNTE
jgi:hypothetical protein